VYFYMGLYSKHYFFSLLFGKIFLYLCTQSFPTYLLPFCLLSLNLDTFFFTLNLILNRGVVDTFFQANPGLDRVPKGLF
jgi:hypothetical protein